MLTILLLLIALIVFDLASLLWGKNSTDDLNSCEWDRRNAWSEALNKPV
jgi:hypothetical protein